MKCLFVGGDHDGETIDVDPDRPHYMMPCQHGADGSPGSL